jgi:oligoendopeptidase F
MPRLRGCDLLAPVAAEKREVLFPEAKQLILDSFAGFHGEFADLAGRMFDSKWIDAEVRPAKRGGAFCAATLPELPPYILMSYDDDIDNVYTLAHELGHALHDFLAARKQSILNFHPPLVAAETASVFAEMLLTKKLLAQFTDRETRIDILTGKLEDLFATIHVQNFYTLFELDAHQLGAQQRLSASDLCALWIKRRGEIYGEAVEFLSEQQWYWSAIPHFIHTRFYCYAYTFGALLVLALYRRYEEEGKSFVPRYVELLEAGGSDKPENLIRKIGFDISDAKFWEGGFAVIRSLLDALKALVGEER